jgi:hypothetical protein
VLELFNHQTGAFEPATLCAIEEQDLVCYRHEWRPLIEAKVEELKRADSFTSESLAQYSIQDEHFDWPEKCLERAGGLQWDSYALRCGGQTQGLMYLNLLQTSRLPGHEKQYMVYVDLLATAPWNRPRLVGERRYGGVGAVLIAEAVLQSIDEDFGGRIGLQSLPQSDSFYEQKLGMTRVEKRDPRQLNYFEFDPESAQAWLARQNGG